MVGASISFDDIRSGKAHELTPLRGLQQALLTAGPSASTMGIIPGSGRWGTAVVSISRLSRTALLPEVHKSMRKCRDTVFIKYQSKMVFIF